MKGIYKSPLSYSMTLKQALVSNSCWKVSSLEEPSFLEDMERIQREMHNIKGNFMSFIFDRNNVIDISERLHEA